MRETAAALAETFPYSGADRARRMAPLGPTSTTVAGQSQVPPVQHESNSERQNYDQQHRIDAHAVAPDVL